MNAAERRGDFDFREVGQRRKRGTAADVNDRPCAAYVDSLRDVVTRSRYCSQFNAIGSSLDVEGSSRIKPKRCQPTGLQPKAWPVAIFSELLKRDEFHSWRFRPSTWRKCMDDESSSSADDRRQTELALS